MKSNRIVDTALLLDGVSKAELARRLEYKSASAVSNALERDMRVDTFVRMMNALGYEVLAKQGDKVFTVTAEKSGD